MSIESVKALRLSLWQNGFRPVAVTSPHALHWTGTPVVHAGKNPNVPGWQERALLDPPDAVTAKVKDDYLNTGIMSNGLQVLDIDVNDAAIVAQIEASAAEHLGSSAPKRVRADSPHCLYLYRSTDGESESRKITGPGGEIEIRGAGVQFVAYGIHPDGVQYHWPNGGPDSFHRDQLTAVTEEAVQRFLETVAPLIGAEAPKMPRVLTVLFPALPIGEPGPRDIACAEKAITEEISLVRTTPQGQGHNDQLFKSAANLFEFVANGSLDGQRVTEALIQASIDAGYADTPSWKNTAMKTIESAFNTGMKKPRPLLAENVPDIDISAMVVNGIAAYKRQHPETSTSGKPDKSSKRSVTLVQCSTIEAKPITWLWNGFIPQGKLTLLAGAGGTGKSTLAFNFAATVSSAGMWPDGSRSNVAANVLVFSSEDDAADTITPRLMAVGANLSRCGIVSGAIDENGLRCPFDAARDMDQLREAAHLIGGVSLLIIDPIVTAVTGDMNKANDVRRSLQAIVDFATETNCAVIGITHFAKGTAGKNSAERVIGSQAFAALARMVLVAAKEEDSDRRVFTRAKSNNSIDTGGFNYSIEAVELHSRIVATRVVWGEPLEGSSRSILAKVEGDSREDGEKMKAAKQFLIEMLSNGPAPAKELLTYAREGYGISDDTLRRAYKEIGTKPSRVGFGSNGAWMWALPFANPLQ